MKLTKSEQLDVKRLLKEAERPGMIIWMESHGNGDVSATGIAEGNPVEVAMMAMQAIDFVAQSTGMKSEQVALKLAQMFSERE